MSKSEEQHLVTQAAQWHYEQVVMADGQPKEAFHRPAAQALREWLEAQQPAHPDDEAVDRFAAALKQKLAEARAKGRGGWQDREDCPQQRLCDMLRDHVEKGDPRDVANFCVFLWARGETILPSQEATQQGVSPKTVEDVAWHIGKSIEYIEKVWPEAKMLDRGPILRNMRRWHERLTKDAKAGGGE